MGRPKSESVAVMLRIPPEMAEEIDNLRRSEQDIPTRQEMIRRILKSALEKK